jgi:tetratricopeptide (TPR) repeat protein
MMRTILIIVSTLLLLAGPARAQDKAVKAAAKAHLEAGEKYQREQKYDQAIAEFEAGFAKLPVPAFLFNIGQAYRLKGDPPNAVLFYQKYLALEPNGRASAEARSHVATLTMEIEAAERAEQERRADAERAAEAERLARAEEELRRREAEEARRKELTEKDRGTGSPGRGLRIAGYASTAVGVILVGTAVYFGLEAGGIADEIETEAAERMAMGLGWTAELEAKERDGQAAERNAIITGVVGGVAIGAGVTL